MKRTNVPTLLAWCVIAASASAAEPPAESRERFVCTFGASQRLVDIYRVAATGARPGCRVDYTKEGVTRQLWSSSGDYAFCVKQAVGLVTKLSKGNFSCKPQTVDQQPLPDDTR
jgi:hypothetical protein